MSRPVTRFRDLVVGSSFDFINPKRPGTASFFLRVTKGGTRRYTDARGVVYTVGSINVPVFHVKPPVAP